jgi:hypothetical protein
MRQNIFFESDINKCRFEELNSFILFEMKWITRERPKIDRIACPWLIRKLIDNEEFEF